jgi:hypothetical protein
VRKILCCAYSKGKNKNNHWHDSGTAVTGHACHSLEGKLTDPLIDPDGMPPGNAMLTYPGLIPAGEASIGIQAIHAQWISAIKSVCSPMVELNRL